MTTSGPTPYPAWTELHFAAQTGDIKKITTLIASGHKVDEERATYIHHPSKKIRFRAIRECAIQSIPFEDVPDHHVSVVLETPLQVAIRCGQTGAFNQLKEKGAKVDKEIVFAQNNLVCLEYNSAIPAICWSILFKREAFGLQQLASIPTDEVSQSVLLMTAFKNGLTLLLPELAIGIDINSRDLNDRSPYRLGKKTHKRETLLENAASYYGNAKMVACLFSMGALYDAVVLKNAIEKAQDPEIIGVLADKITADDVHSLLVASLFKEQKVEMILALIGNMNVNIFEVMNVNIFDMDGWDYKWESHDAFHKLCEGIAALASHPKNGTAIKKFLLWLSEKLPAELSKRPPYHDNPAIDIKMKNILHFTSQIFNDLIFNHDLPMDLNNEIHAELKKQYDVLWLRVNIDNNKLNELKTFIDEMPFVLLKKSIKQASEKGTDDLDKISTYLKDIPKESPRYKEAHFEYANFLYLAAQVSDDRINCLIEAFKSALLSGDIKMVSTIALGIMQVRFNENDLKWDDSQSYQSQATGCELSTFLVNILKCDSFDVSLNLLEREIQLRVEKRKAEMEKERQLQEKDNQVQTLQAQLLALRAQLAAAAAPQRNDVVTTPTVMIQMSQDNEERKRQRSDESSSHSTPSSKRQKQE